MTRAVLVGWRYHGGKRDLRLDLIRGAAVVAMVADHVGGAHSWFYALTGGDRFFVSAAELFVAISGFVMGIVYAGLIVHEGMSAAFMRAFKRAWMLYGLTVGLTLAFAATAGLLGLWWRPTFTRGGAVDFVVGLVTLHQGYYLTDIPLMYTLIHCWCWWRVRYWCCW